MVFEEYIPTALFGGLIGVARGLKGFADNKKENPGEGFELGKFAISVVVCAGVGVVAELVSSYAALPSGVVIDFVAQYVAPWVGTDVVERIFLK